MRTVNQYTDEIREIERRIQLAAKSSDDVPELDLPPGIPEQFDEHIKLHCDMVALAFKADITRVATLLGARDLTGRVYPFPKSELFPDGGTSVELPWRLASPGRPGADSPLRRTQPLSRLDDGVPGEEAEVNPRTATATCSTSSLILYGSNMGNSNQHQHFDVPHICSSAAPTVSSRAIAISSTSARR